jgi:hypothetical protein
MTHLFDPVDEDLYDVGDLVVYKGSEVVITGWWSNSTMTRRLYQVSAPGTWTSPGHDCGNPLCALELVAQDVTAPELTPGQGFDPARPRDTRMHVQRIVSGTRWSGA